MWMSILNRMHGSVQIARPLFHLHDFSIEAMALEIRDLQTDGTSRRSKARPSPTLSSPRKGYLKGCPGGTGRSDTYVPAVRRYDSAGDK
jgi:hypothetical protein